MAIIKRGDITVVSKALPDLMGTYREKAKKALDGALRFGIGQALKQIGEMDPIRRRENSEYLAFMLKHFFQQLAPELHGAGTQHVERVADRFAEETPALRDFVAFCRAFNVDPVASRARLINSDILYANAATYYTFKGGLYECYQGNMFGTAINKRREFTMYLPNPPMLLPKTGFSFTIRQDELRK